MHNCRETKEQITEFVLDGADRRADEVLLAELRACAECREEFNALNATLRVTTRLREISAPSEPYWSGYHEKLRHKLVDSQRIQSISPSWFARVFNATVPVPVPVAAALVMACAVLIPIAIRAARQQPQPQTPSRVVYRDRRAPARNAKRVVDPSTTESTFARSQKPQNVEIPATLIGFKPTEEVKLTIIKGGSQNEK
jgi:hypothetical protein